MNILVSGAFGFIASHVITKLLQDGHKVLGFDNLTNPSLNPTDRIKSAVGDKWANFTFYKCDIRDLNQMSSIIVNNPVDCIVHLAALGSVPRSFNNPAEVIEVNEKGFANVCMLATMTSKRKLIYASSSSVYGSDTSPLRTESKVGLPLSPYALSKLHNELFAKMWCTRMGINHIGLRFFNVYGEGQRHDSEYSAVIPRFLNDKEININGDGSVTRDFTYVGDVANAINNCLGYNFDDVFNVCTGIGTSIKDLAHMVNVDSRPINYLPSRKSDVNMSIGNPSYAKTRLKFEAKTKLQDGLKVLIGN